MTPTPAATTPAPGTLLSRVTTGRIKKPHLILIHGPDGVGKSTLAGDAPKPIFLGAEDGSNSLNVTRMPQLINYQMCVRGLQELLNENHDFQTAVIDTLDWLEAMIFQDVCDEHKAKNIEDYNVKALGFAKGYLFALERWKEIMMLLTRLREERAMNIICIAHTTIKKFEDPSTPSGYERYQIKLRSSAGADAAALWREYVDNVLFANYLTTTLDSDKKRGFGDGTRVLYTERRPGWDAKNRLGLPFQLPLSWQDFAEAAAKGEPESADTLLEQIAGLKAQVKQKELYGKIDGNIKAAGKSTSHLLKIKNRLEALIGSQG